MRKDGQPKPPLGRQLEITVVDVVVKGPARQHRQPLVCIRPPLGLEAALISYWDSSMQSGASLFGHLLRPPALAGMFMCGGGM